MAAGGLRSFNIYVPLCGARPELLRHLYLRIAEHQLSCSEPDQCTSYLHCDISGHVFHRDWSRLQVPYSQRDKHRFSASC
jgi:hypothetical protein